jgi:hypothetical protein
MRFSVDKLLAFALALGLSGSLLDFRASATLAAPALPPADLAARLEAHVRVLAEDIGERNWRRHAELSRARDYVARTLKSYGYKVRREPYRVKGKLCENLIAELPGTDPALKREIVVAGAHYDSASGTPGADDNASGVALLLELARRFRDKPAARTLRFAAFSTEEAYIFKGLTDRQRWATMGSHHHARAARKRGDRIVAMVSLEMMGYYSDLEGSQDAPRAVRWFYPSKGDFALVVGDLRSRRLVQALKFGMEGGRLPVQAASLPRFVPGVGDSDHRNFWAAGYPAAMITDTAFYRNRHYHRATDTADTLDYRKMAEAAAGVEEALRLVGM